MVVMTKLIQSSPTCRSVNVMGIFNSPPPPHKPWLSLLYIPCTSWYFTTWPTVYAEDVGYASYSLETMLTTLSKLHVLYNSCLVMNNVTNPNSNECKFTTIALDIARHRLFKPVGIKKCEINNRSFHKLSFTYKSFDGINLGNILHHKLVNSKIPPYFTDQSVLIIPYAYWGSS